VLTNEAAGGTLLATVSGNKRTLETLRRRGVQVVVLPGRNGLLSLKRLLALLGKRGIMSIMIEGGANLAAAALREGVVDHLWCFLAPKLIGADGLPMLAPLGIKDPRKAMMMRQVRVERVGSDMLVRAVVKKTDGI